MTKDAINPELKKHIPKSGLVLILGTLGSGKSVLGYSLIDAISRETNRKAYVHGFPWGKANLLPRSISTLRQGADLPEYSVVLLDEAYYYLYAREHYSQINKRFGRLAGLSRQKGILAIYISQEAGKL